MPDDLLAGQVTAGESQVAQTEAAPTNAATTEGQTDGSEGGNDSPEQKTFTQKELDEILQKRVAKAEARAERRVLKTLERWQQQQTQAQQPTQQQEADSKPTRREGETDDAYLDRLTDWKLDQREKRSTQQREQQEAEIFAKKTANLYAEAQKLDGFDREAFDELPLTRPIIAALVDSDNAPALMKHMADHPEDIERIAKLSPARQAAELGRMEASLPAATTKTTTNALPAPINPLRRPSSGTPVYDTTDPRAAKSMSASDWIAAERKRVAALRANR
jgi:hypothetical protein